MKALTALLLFAGIAPLLAWLERRQLQLMEGASSPGAGVWSPVAEGVKLLTKEDVTAAGADRRLRALAPVLSALLALLALGFIPWGAAQSFWGIHVDPALARLDGAALLLLALTSLGVFGAVLGGWASGNRWGALGALRASAQALSYGAPLGASLIGVFLAFQTLSLDEMVRAQQSSFRVLGFIELLGGASGAWIDALRLPTWGAIVQPVAFGVFVAAALAWTGRPPFDAPVSAADVAGGHAIGYGGAHVALSRLAASAQRIALAGWITAMFLGGWSLPWLSDAELLDGLRAMLGADLAGLLALVIGLGAFAVKLVALLFALTLVERTLPRFRHDQVMTFGWKILLPLALANVLLSALGVVAVGELG